MSTSEPRSSIPRSSFAIAIKDYTFIRPGIAVSISAATLIVALALGLNLIASLGRAARTVEQGARAAQALNRYDAGIEVWRRMATSADPAYRTPEATAQRDSIREALRTDIAGLAASIDNPIDQDLARTVLAGLTSTDDDTARRTREAMIVLLAHQDAALFGAARAAPRGVLLAA